MCTEQQYCNRIVQLVNGTSLEELKYTSDFLKTCATKGDTRRIQEFLETYEAFPIENDYEELIVPNDRQTYRILIVSDTHIGNVHSRLDFLKYLYEKAEKNDTDFVIHGGDIVEGTKINNTKSEFELQMELLINEYPKSSIPTYMIGGDQDQFVPEDCNVKEVIDKYRTDLTMLGYHQANIRIGNLKTRIYHGTYPNWGVDEVNRNEDRLSYSKNRKPHLIVRGHSHLKYKSMKNHVLFLQAAAMVGPIKDYSKSDFEPATVAAWWLEITIQNNKIRHHKTRLEVPTLKKLMR